VAAGLADRCEIQIAYAIGVAHPLSINVETFGTGKIDDSEITRLVSENFDLRPGAIIRDLNLRRPIYQRTAAYGHFGRTDIDAPWENTDRAATLRAAARLTEASAGFKAKGERLCLLLNASSAAASASPSPSRHRRRHRPRPVGDFNNWSITQDLAEARRRWRLVGAP
jgi:hypothetical protein